VNDPAVDHCAAPVLGRIVVGVDGGEGGVRDTALRTIGVGCDGSAESLGALALARRIAVAAGGSLRTYTVAVPLPMWPATAGGPGRSEADAVTRRRARARLGAAVADVG
jgi:hypothetical protein